MKLHELRDQLDWLENQGRPESPWRNVIGWLLFAGLVAMVVWWRVGE